MRKIVILLALVFCGGTATAFAMPVQSQMIETGIERVGWAPGCPPGYHLGPYGQRCWARFACPPGFHAGYYGNSCQANRPRYRPRPMPRSVPRGEFYYR